MRRAPAGVALASPQPAATAPRTAARPASIAAAGPGPVVDLVSAAAAATTARAPCVPAAPARRAPRSLNAARMREETAFVPRWAQIRRGVREDSSLLPIVRNVPPLRFVAPISAHFSSALESAVPSRGSRAVMWDGARRRGLRRRIRARAAGGGGGQALGRRRVAIVGCGAAGEHSTPQMLHRRCKAIAPRGLLGP